MKKSALIFLVSLIGFVGCDVVDYPYDTSGAGPGDEQFNDTVYNDTTVNIRRIFLEEFTGHTCPNCPEGQDIAKQLAEDHPDTFLVVSIHNSGAFSKPDMSKPDKPYPENFETETGEKLRIKYQFSAFPGGMLNRTEINGNVKVDYKKWGQEVTILLADNAYMTPRFRLQLENIYNSKPGDRSLRVRYKATALTSLSGNFAIAAYVAESKIIAPQTDNRLSDSYVPDYEHNHLLRVGFPGNGDGKTIFTDPEAGDITEVISENDEISVALSDEWKPENMEVIVFIFNATTGEIFHVEHTHLTK